MASSFTWLDYSEHERRKVLDLVSTLGPGDTRDELGIGAVRDSFADLFFPGTSTIQTRARYFLFIPWIYLDLERRKIRSAEVATTARREEVGLIDPLAGSADPEGTIGIEAGPRLQRLPSNVYWLGLERWGIRLFHGSQDQYHRAFDAFHRSERSARNDDGEPIDGVVVRNWHAGLPQRPAAFPQKASFSLTPEEADYLRERIMVRAPRTLLSFLMDRGRPSDPTRFPWEHPQFAEFPEHIREQLAHARRFSEVVHGSALLYNLMLSKLASREDLLCQYRDRIGRWLLDLDQRREDLAGWDLQQFWKIVESSGARITRPTRLFVDGWITLALAPKPGDDLGAHEQAKRMVEDRERQLKGREARLDEDNRAAREQWGGEAGTGRLNYRWPVAQRMVSDILSALHQEGEDAQTT